METCTDAQLARLVPSSEGAELLTAAAMMNCSREIAAAINAILRTKPRMNDVETSNQKLELRNAMRRVVLSRAVEMRADKFRAQPVPPPTQSAPMPPARPQSVSSGTGFVISDQGYVLTNSHVVKGCVEPKVFPSSGLMFTGRVLAKDEKSDLAVIATALRPTTVPGFRTAVKLGESVAIFGYPFAGLLSSSGNFSTGNVTATKGIADDISWLQISAPVQPGNSGGPLLDETGNVVGVVVAKLDALKMAEAAKDIPQNINFAIRAAIATAFLEANNIDFKTGDRGAVRPSTEIAEQAKRISVRIQCDGTDQVGTNQR